MRAEDIAEHESGFDNRGIDAHGKKHILTQRGIQIPGESGRMHYVKLEPSYGDDSYFFRSKPDKDQIVQHYTVGYLKGDIASLTTPDHHVSVPFVIGRNGTIYNLFHSGFWAYHLGRGAIGGNTARSRATIGIELSNIGPLIKRGDNLTTYYSDTDTYCTIDESSLYQQVNYRRFEYYATFTNAQYGSLITLLRYLTARYDIKREFLPDSKRYEAHSGVKEFGGIVSHVNYRRSGKEDLGPAFDWDRLIQGVKA
jgi:N-acetyl-anhydromuramyl-L-alanine amidase AmpD